MKLEHLSTATLVVFLLGLRMIMANVNFASKCRKIVGAGINYKASLALTNASKPENPIIFLKPSSTLVQANENAAENYVEIPKVFKNVNFEAELGVVIGKTGKNIDKERAFDYISGYCLALDMTGMEAINIAKELRQSWDLGKSFDRATPVGRFLTPAEVGNPEDIRVWAKVNGEFKQDDSTKNLIFSIPELLAYISRYMSLEENDLILTGTPVGAGPVTEGDQIECGLGDLTSMIFSVRKEK